MTSLLANRPIDEMFIGLWRFQFFDMRDGACVFSMPLKLEAWRCRKGTQKWTQDMGAKHQRSGGRRDCHWFPPLTSDH